MGIQIREALPSAHWRGSIHVQLVPTQQSPAFNPTVPASADPICQQRNKGFLEPSLQGAEEAAFERRAGEPQHPLPRFILILVMHNNATSQKFGKLNFQGQMALPTDAVEDEGTQFLMFTSEISFIPVISQRSESPALSPIMVMVTEAWSTVCKVVLLL